MEALDPYLEMFGYILPLWFDQLFTQIGGQVTNDLGPASAALQNVGFPMDKLAW